VISDVTFFSILICITDYLWFFSWTADQYTFFSVMKKEKQSGEIGKPWGRKIVTTINPLMPRKKIRWNKSHRGGMKAITLTQFKNEHTLSKSLEKSSSTRIVSWLNSKFKQLSSETLLRTIILLWPGRKPDWNGAFARTGRKEIG
jgi:hypothetical protein